MIYVTYLLSMTNIIGIWVTSLPFGSQTICFSYVDHSLTQMILIAGKYYSSQIFRKI